MVRKSHRRNLRLLMICKIESRRRLLVNRNLGGSLRGITWFSAFSWGAEGRNYFDCQLTAIRGDHKNVTVHYGGSGEFCRHITKILLLSWARKGTRMKVALLRLSKGHVCSSALCFCTIISVTVKGLLLMNILVKV